MFRLMLMVQAVADTAIAFRCRHVCGGLLHPWAGDEAPARRRKGES
jgi:hypothetical protein